MIDGLGQPSPAARAIVLLVVGVSAVGVGLTLGLPVALLFGAGAALVLTILLLWNSIQSLTGEAPLTLEEAVSLGALTAEEEQKRAVLRALKDLEYERSVGKISEEDYRALSAKYRAEARALLRRVDASLGPARERAEDALRERLAAAGFAEAAAGGPAGVASATTVVSEPPPAERDTTSESHAASPDGAPGQLLCTECDTGNDLDARFCKGCGRSLAQSEAS